MRGNKKLIISIVAAGACLVGFIVALCLVFMGPHELNDIYFINSDRRIVSSMDNPSSRLMFGAKTLHKVYETEGDKITSYKLYYVFDDAGTASEKFSEVKAKSLEDMNVVDVTQDKKYVIVTMSDVVYKNSRAQDIRDFVKRMEKSNQTYVEPSTTDPTEPIEDYYEEDE